jgi:hypothetical protein
MSVLIWSAPASDIAHQHTVVPDLYSGASAVARGMLEFWSSANATLDLDVHVHGPVALVGRYWVQVSPTTMPIVAKIRGEAA